MKLFHYVSYFFYIAVNWNIRLAIFTIFHEIKGERKYRLDTGKMNDLKGLAIAGSNLPNAEMYQGSNYFLLEAIFSYLQKVNANKHIVDYGCGKGRVLVVAAYYGFNEITGIDFAAELCLQAKRNIIPTQLKFPETVFRIIHADAAEYPIDDHANVFFFFNPFREQVMLTVVKNILQSLKKNTREIYVVYINPVHKEIFMSAGFEEVEYFERLYYIQASILKKSPGSGAG